MFSRCTACGRGPTGTVCRRLIPAAVAGSTVRERPATRAAMRRGFVMGIVLLPTAATDHLTSLVADPNADKGRAAPQHVALFGSAPASMSLFLCNKRSVEREGSMVQLRMVPLLMVGATLLTVAPPAWSAGAVVL